MMFVLFPVAGVFLDVSAEPQKGLFVGDDLVIETVLPVEVAPAHGPDAAGAGALELPDDHAQGARGPVQRRRLNEEDTVEMIGHHDPGVQLEIGTAPGGLDPFFRYDLSEV